MSGTARTLARAGMVVTSAYLASRLLGWLRTVVISSIYGASPDLDAYFAAFRIPDLVFQLVAAGALSSALIPVLAGLIANEEEARSWRVVSTVANLMLIALVMLSAPDGRLAPWIVPVITPGFGPAQTELTIELTRIMLLSPILLALGALATSVLNARDRFSVASLAPDRLQRGHHRLRRRAGARSWASRAWPSPSCWARLAHLARPAAGDRPDAGLPLPVRGRRPRSGGPRVLPPDGALARSAWA